MKKNLKRKIVSLILVGSSLNCGVVGACNPNKKVKIISFPIHIMATESDHNLFMAFKAIDDGDFQLLKTFVLGGLSANSCDENGFTLLHAAVYKKNLRMVKFLLARGANINALDEDGNNLLHIASQVDAGILMFLVRIGLTDINTVNNYGETPIFKAVEKKNISAVKFLFDNNADMRCKNKFRCPLIHLAVKNKDKRMLKFLVENGASVNESDRQGEIPLNIAIKCEYFEIFDELIKYGADINKKGKDGQTPLYLAMINNINSVFCKLMFNNVDPNLIEESQMAKLKKSVLGGMYNNFLAYKETYDAGERYQNIHDDY